MTIVNTDPRIGMVWMVHISVLQPIAMTSFIKIHQVPVSWIHGSQYLCVPFPHLQLAAIMEYDHRPGRLVVKSAIIKTRKFCVCLFTCNHINPVGGLLHNRWTWPVFSTLIWSRTEAPQRWRPWALQPACRSPGTQKIGTFTPKWPVSRENGLEPVCQSNPPSEQLYPGKTHDDKNGKFIFQWSKWW